MGHYMEASSMGIGSLVKLFESRRDEFCISYWYHFQLSSESFLMVKVLKESGEEIHLATYDQDRGSIWRFDTFSLKADESFEVSFEAHVTDEFASFALDDIEVTINPCPTMNSCDFEDGTMCAWHNVDSGEDQSDWLLTAGSTHTEETGPSFDHTTGSSFGYYVYIDSTLFDGNAILESSIMEVNQEHCLTLWYHMFGADVGELEVTFENYSSNSSIVAFNEFGDHADKWNKAFMEVSYEESPYSLLIRIRANTSGVAFRGDIAIDDLQMEPRSCLTPTTPMTPPSFTTASPILNLSCNFEEHTFCNFTNNGTDNLAWDLARQEQDHTTGTGYYIVMDFNQGNGEPNSQAALQSPMIPKEPNLCLSFWCKQVAAQGERFQVEASTLDFQSTWTLFERQGYQGYQWRQAQVPLAPSEWDMMESEYQLNFLAQPDPNVRKIATHGGNGRNQVLIDDILISPGECSERWECDFENSLGCGWLSHPESQIRWSRLNSFSYLGGPKLDHSLGSEFGHYMALTNEEPRPNETFVENAFLDSPDIQGGSELCVKFYYFMDCTGCELQGYADVPHDKGHLQGIGKSWHTRGQQGAFWWPGQFTANLDVSYMIRFNGTISNDEGRLALDDIRFENGQCVPTECDFQTDLCSWTQASSMTLPADHLDFSLENAITLDQDPNAPSFDHSLLSQEGRFLWLPVRSDPSLEATLLSKALWGDQNHCLSFFTWTQGKTVPGIAIQAFNLVNGSVTNEIGKLADYQGPSWVRHQFEYSVPNDHRVGLRVSGSQGSTEGLAVDDIGLIEGPCPSPPSDQADCGNGEFVPHEAVCNFRLDCSNGHDELNCGDCSFGDYDSSDICGYSIMECTDYTWKVSTPEVNCTHGICEDASHNPKGHFLKLVEAQIEDCNQPTRTIFLSPTLRDSSPDCEFSFW
ncbi:MAM and LDL-receptor class A domain-containing protein 1-like [Tigriopus californicus]|uniref:MAM and LDL-receptor class A domain-containing protein 1-like n=1 Tax=Tigriopus californicus TaxID=6832 RepID=UPI0027D9E4B3|nr:MAM and LDL-receptor class A domain-containing protein 1-like [Tigriopus californicus]